MQGMVGERWDVRASKAVGPSQKPGMKMMWGLRASEEITVTVLLIWKVGGEKWHGWFLLEEPSGFVLIGGELWNWASLSASSVIEAEIRQRPSWGLRLCVCIVLWRR